LSHIHRPAERRDAAVELGRARADRFGAAESFAGAESFAADFAGAGDFAGTEDVVATADRGRGVGEPVRVVGRFERDFVWWAAFALCRVFAR